MHISQNKDLQSFEVMSQVMHEESLIGRLVENPKSVHSHINSKKSAHSAVGPLKLPTGFFSDPLEMSRCLLLLHLFFL